MEIGQKLKELRLQRKLSLEQLAQQVGLTRSFISQVEKNKTSPSIASLIKILAALHVRMSDFFQSLDPVKGVVLHREQQQFFYDPQSKLRVASLAAGYSSPKMAPFYGEMEPGNMTEYISSKGEIFFFVLTGSIELTLDETTHLLHPGDSVYFDAAVPHRWKAVGSTKSSGLFVTDEGLVSIG